MDYMSVKKVSEKYGVTKRWIQKLCETGKIQGAVKLDEGGIWLIPKDAEVVLERKKSDNSREL